MVTVAKISSSLGLFKSPRALFVSVSPSFLLVNSSYYSVYGKAPSCLSPTRWKCSKQPVLQYYYIAASHGSSLRPWRTRSVLWHVLLSDHVEHRAESTGYQMVSSTASRKQLPLLKESGYGNWGSLVMCSACLKRSQSENLQFMFLFIGVHPEDSEPRSPIIFIYILGDADSLLNNNQLLQMAQDGHRRRKRVVDCSAAEG